MTEIMPSSINTPFFAKARTRLGVEPKGLAPFYNPRLVATAILYAAEHPVRELVVSGAGRALIFGKQVAPGLVEKLTERWFFNSQHSTIPKTETAPDNLFQPLEHQNSSEGRFHSLTRDSSIYSWL